MAFNPFYRRIVTAQMYQNEEIIGKVLRRWLDSGNLKREELFVVTKVNNFYTHLLHDFVKQFKLPPIGTRDKHVSYFLQKQLKDSDPEDFGDCSSYT